MRTTGDKASATLLGVATSVTILTRTVVTQPGAAVLPPTEEGREGIVVGPRRGRGLGRLVGMVVGTVVTT